MGGKKILVALLLLGLVLAGGAVFMVTTAEPAEATCCWQSESGAWHCPCWESDSGARHCCAPPSY